MWAWLTTFATTAAGGLGWALAWYAALAFFAGGAPDLSAAIAAAPGVLATTTP